MREAVVRTYATTSTADAWTLVQQYEQVREYTAAHPNQGSAAVATALDLPRSRLRAWVDGDGRPDAVRGLERLTRRGWLHLDWGDRTVRALAVLAAWLSVGGSIAREGWVPSWSVSPGTSGELARAGAVLGLDWQQRHADADLSGTEWLPTRDGSVLGRLLAVLGAPVGDDTQPVVPPWLDADACPRGLRLDVARVLVCQRGTDRPERPTRPIHLTVHDATERAAIRASLICSSRYLWEIEGEVD